MPNNWINYENKINVDYEIMLKQVLFMCANVLNTCANTKNG